MATEDSDLAAVYFEGIDHFCHTFMEYQAPRMSHVNERDFEIYKDVISGVYRFHDMMHGGMLQLVDTAAAELGAVDPPTPILFSSTRTTWAKGIAIVIG